MNEKVLFTVGNVLRGDDSAGPVLAKMMNDQPVEGWKCIDGGQTPEDDIAVVRRMSPSQIVLVDAAQMGLPVGSVRRLSARDVAQQFLITTHSLPITFLIGELEKVSPSVIFLGIQPGTLDFYDPMSGPVRESVEEIYECVVQGWDFCVYEEIVH